MRRACLVCLLCTLLFTGCTMGPDYKRPSVEIPSSFRFQPGEAAATADTEWWKGFGDPALDRLIDEALRNNKNLEAAAANIEQASGSLMGARSYLFPQVGYSGSASRTRLPESGSAFVLTKNPFSAFQALAGASWEIDLWGRYRRLTESARASLLASEEARRGVILSLVAETATAYFQLRALDGQLQVARSSLDTYVKAVDLFETQHDHGQVSQMTVAQAHTQYETAAAAIPQLESQIAVTENALSLLLGRNPGPIARGRTLAELTAPPVPAVLPSGLLERRPDLLQAEQELVAANARIGAAKALYFPDISLTGSYGRASGDLSDLFKGSSRTWSYAGSLTGPLFTAGRVAGQVKQAEGARKAALAAYEGAVQNAFADAENAFVSHSKLSEQLSAEQRRVAAFREYERLAWDQYHAGYAPYLNVLYAQSQLFPAELSAISTRAATLIGVVNVYKAMGGGWVERAGEVNESGTGPEAAK
jgi:outer membrane protein, multidrug efflux system